MYQKPQNTFLIPWPAVIIGLIIFWPVGIALLILRLYKDKQAALRVGQVLKIISYIIFGFTALALIITLSEPDEAGWIVVSFFFLLGLSLFLISRKLISDARRTRQYMTSIINHHERDLDNIASMLNIPYDKVRLDIAKLIDHGLLKGAVIDHANRRIRLPQDSNPASNNNQAYEQANNQGDPNGQQRTPFGNLNTIHAHNSYTVSNASANIDPKTLDKLFDNMNEVMSQINIQSTHKQQAAAQQATGPQQPAPQPRVSQCKFCGANNSVSNNTGECEYCGSPLR